MTTALYAGSFDPPHLGHLTVIERAAQLCETLFVVATGNPDKGDALFDLSQRRDLLAASTSHLDNVRAMHHQGLTVELSADLGADCLVRGIGKEQQTELEMAAMNRRMSGITTLFIPPHEATSGISSRHIRSTYRRHGAHAVAGLVPPPVLEYMRRVHPTPRQP